MCVCVCECANVGPRFGVARKSALATGWDVQLLKDSIRHAWGFGEASCPGGEGGYE